MYWKVCQMKVVTTNMNSHFAFYSFDVQRRTGPRISPINPVGQTISQSSPVDQPLSSIGKLIQSVLSIRPFSQSVSRSDSFYFSDLCQWNTWIEQLCAVSPTPVASACVDAQFITPQADSVIELQCGHRVDNPVFSTVITSTFGEGAGGSGRIFISFQQSDTHSERR